MSDPAVGPPPTPPRSLSVTLAGRSALALVALVVNGLARVISSLVVGRVAGVVSLGFVQSGLAGAQLAGLFGPSAFGSAASAFVARQKAEGDEAGLSAVHGHLLLRVLQTSTLVVAVSGLVWLLLPSGEPSRAVAFAVLTLSFCLFPFSRGLLYGAGLAARAATWNIATSMLGLVVVCVGVLAGLRGAALLLLFSSGYFAFSVLSWQRTRPRRIRGPLGREIDKFAAFAVAGTVASAGFLNATMVTASVIGDAEAVGHFGAAFALAVPSSLIAAAVSLVLFPLLSGLRGAQDEHRTKAFVGWASRCMSMPVVCLFAILVLLRREVVDILWGPSFAEASLLLAPLLIALLCTTLAVPSVNALTALDPRGMMKSAVSSSIGLCAGLLTWALAVPHLGLLGVACGFTIGSLASSAIPFVLAWRYTGQTWGWHAARLVFAVLVLAGLAGLQVRWSLSTATTIALLFGYLAGWILLTLPEVRRIWGTSRAAIGRQPRHGSSKSNYERSDD